MILGKPDLAAVTGARATLDDLFRRAGVRRADAPALVDPPNRKSFTTGAPRCLSYAQADRAISALAARLHRIGLPTDSVVAFQLPNTVESIVTLLGVLRAGMIAAPLPLLWREQDMVAALRLVGAKAIIASSRIGGAAPAETAMRAAAELFPVRFVCGFGRGLPDGVVALDDIFNAGPFDFVAPAARPGLAGAHVAVVSFDIGGSELLPFARNHMQLIAGGRAVFLEAGMAADATLLSTIPIGSFAGMAMTVMPWLLSGGTLALHHGFEPESFAAQFRADSNLTVIVPGPALTPLREAGLFGSRTILALWRAPERLAAAEPWPGDAALIDVASFREIGLLPARRGHDGLPAAIPFGPVDAPRGVATALAVAVTARSRYGTLSLRGAMMPTHSFSPGAPALAADGFVDTGFACRLDRATQTLTVTAPPAGTAGVGGYRFRMHELDELVARIDPAAAIVALPDAALGERLAGRAGDAASMQNGLLSAGANPLIAGAFSPRGLSSAA